MQKTFCTWTMVVLFKYYGIWICSHLIPWYYGQHLKSVCIIELLCWSSDSEVCSASCCCCCSGFGLIQDLFHKWENKRGANISKRGKNNHVWNGIYHTISTVLLYVCGVQFVNFLYAWNTWVTYYIYQNVWTMYHTIVWNVSRKCKFAL